MTHWCYLSIHSDRHLILAVTLLFSTWTEKRKMKWLDIYHFSQAGFFFWLGRWFFWFTGTILKSVWSSGMNLTCCADFLCNLCSLFLSFFATVAPRCCSVFNVPPPPPPFILHLTSEPQITLFKGAHGPKDAGGAAETCVPSSLVQGTFCTGCSWNPRL